MTDQPPYQPSSYQNPGYLPYASWTPLKHSGVGVASFIIGIAMGLMELALLVLATVLVQQRTSQQAPAMVVAGCGMLLGLAACFVGVILGIVGVKQLDRRKVFAVWGLCINALILLAVAGLIALGLAFKH